jgi:nucleotide-binding universal stress UspA family protein
MNPILVGIDGSVQCWKAFEHALALASLNQTPLHVVAVVHGPEIELAEADERRSLVERRSRQLDDELSRARERAAEHSVTAETHLLEGHPVECILELATRIRAGHVVVGHRSKGLFERLLLGSVAKRVVDFARCTVTVVR